jgi:eukaryotic-like serine/threonine-protein kinase
MSSSPPTTLGKYQIIREIARSNDIVYEAYDPLMNRRVAVKELAMPTGANDAQREDRLKRFLREARAAGSLQHPNIMTVFEVGEDAGRHYIAMEYLDGHTLRNEVDTKGFLPPDEAVNVAKNVLAGLDYAHTKGVIHRDIKPDNIQLLTDGSIKITDFGIARLTFEPNLTMDGQVFGTPSYMSPEQIVGREIDARSDLFSVGVLLYEMICGQKPFAGDNVLTITHQIMNKEPDRPQQANFALWQVIEKSLDKSPQLRYPNAQAMSQALDDALRAIQPGSMVIDPNPQWGGNVYQPQPGGFQAGPPPVVYPYNPYGSPQPAFVPPPQVYGQPIPGPSMPPPQQAPYAGSMPAQNMAPIYYPPPPRRPLFKPETKFLLGRIFIVTLVMAAVLTGFIFIASTISKFFTSQPPAASKTAQDQQIEGLKNDFETNQDPQTAAKLAQTYYDRAQSKLRNNDRIAAINDLETARSTDPEFLPLYPALANAYENSIQSAADPDKVHLLENAADTWADAADRERDPVQAEDYKRRAAEDYLILGQQYSKDDRPKARDFFRKGRRAAPKGSQVAADLDEAYNKLN